LPGALSEFENRRSHLRRFFFDQIRVLKLKMARPRFRKKHAIATKTKRPE
jgi:hypothetical protein